MGVLSVQEQPGFRLIDGADINTISTAVNNLASGTTSGTYTGTFTGTLPVGNIVGGAKRVTTQVDRASSTTLTDITGLFVALAAGGVYAFTAYLPGTATANGGAKFAVGTSDTLSATSISYTGRNMNGATVNAATISTSLGGAVGAATAVLTYAVIDGTIVVNAAGTLTIQIAQNASHADTTSAYVNGHLVVTRIA